MKNSEKIKLILNDLKEWANCADDRSDGMLFALDNGFNLHAARCWYDSGAMSEGLYTQLRGVKFDDKKEREELKQLFKICITIECKDCNHVSFYLKDEVPGSISCPSCGSKKCIYKSEG